MMEEKAWLLNIDFDDCLFLKAIAATGSSFILDNAVSLSSGYLNMVSIFVKSFSVQNFEGCQAVKGMVRPVVVIIDSLPDKLLQGFKVGDGMVVKKTVFELFVYRFDHGVGKLNIQLCDQVLYDRRMVGSGDQVNHAVIFWAIICNELAGLHAGGLQVLLLHCGECIKHILRFADLGSFVGKDSAGVIVLYEVYIVFGIVEGSVDIQTG